MRSAEMMAGFAVTAFLIIGVAAFVRDDVRKASRANQQRQLVIEKQQQAEQERKTPYLMGYDACAAGVKMSKNPYNFLHNRDYAEWQRGWVQCQEDKKKGK